MRINKYSLAIMLSTFLCFGLQAQQDFNIYLQAEIFTPNTSLALPSQTIEDGYYHVIIQFEELPSKATHALIKLNGITLDGYLPKNAYYARIPETVNSSFLQSINVRSVFPVKAIWKKDSRLANLPSHATTVEGMADLNIRYFKNTDLSVTATVLQNNQAEILQVNDDLHQFVVRVSTQNIQALAEENVISWIEPIDPTMELENRQSKSNHGSSALSANYLGGRNLQGSGIRIGVWDTNLYPHHDFDTRATGHEFLYTSTRSADHCNHVVGTIAGAGWLDPNALGMAPEATIHAWNCCTNLPLPYPTSMRNAVLNQDITITSNSYGWGIDGDNCATNQPATYSGLTQALDQLVIDFPSLMHVYSAGNDQQTCPNPYYSTTWTHKNSLLVAATNQVGGIASFSSFGPMYDGRIAPTISGVGSNVYSTEWDNEYGNKSGTSMSCPGVSGTIAQLYERYKQLHTFNPRADLIKALVCNTAQDAGNIGPDYTYGFGQISALKAVEAMENGSWLLDSVQSNMSNTMNITVPQNMAQLRITLAWTDVAGSSSASFALVNNLDMFLTNGVDTIRPWILDPNTPTVPATTGIDNVNNIEQITIDSLSAGTYQLIVNGTTVANGSQTYALVYQTIMPEITITNPFGGEKFVSGRLENIHWTATGSYGDFNLEYSIDSGANWITLTTVPSYTRSVGWSVPYYFTSKALFKITSTNLTDVSDATFTIAPTPTFTLGVEAASPLCGEQAQMIWPSIAGATGYEIYQIDASGLNSLAITSDTFYNISSLPTQQEFWFTMRAIRPSDELYGERAIAKSITLVPTYDLGLDEIVNPVSACGLGQENITIKVSNLGCKTFLVGERIPIHVELNGTPVFTDSLVVVAPFYKDNQETFTFSIPVDLSAATNYYNIKTIIGIVEDTIASNNALTKQVVHQPTFSNVPYVESFEANNGYWSTRGVNSSTSWEWGTPTSSFFNPASNGSKVWATGLSNDYTISEVSNAFSPCFDFTSETSDLYLIYDVKHNLGGSIDRSRMQYSLNEGASWINLGGFFLGNSSGWETKQFLLSGSAGKSDVKFRMMLYSDGNEDVGEGVAIDHFRISPTPFFTNTNDLEVTSNLEVYPNPSSGAFNVAVQNMAGERVTFSVIDAFGKLITSYEMTISDQEQVIRLDLSQYAKGLYLLQMKSDTEQATKKIIVE